LVEHIVRVLAVVEERAHRLGDTEGRPQTEQGHEEAEFLHERSPAVGNVWTTRRLRRAVANIEA
jgi:hypothetical protein